MKKAFFVLTVLISMVLASCAEEKYHILPFENKNAVIECTVNGKFDAIIKNMNGALSLSVLAPEEIKGISFVFSDTEDKMISGEISIPISRKTLGGIYAIASVPELSEEAMTSAVSKGGMGEISIEKDNLSYTLFFNTDGALTDIKITGDGLDYIIKIKSISVTE